MSIDIEALRKSLDDITQEQIDIYFPPDTKPKGWLSIDEFTITCSKCKEIEDTFSLNEIPTDYG